MRLSLELVVIAIIIIVVSVVVITIFGGGIGMFGIATDARANCIQQGKWSCEAGGSMPIGWDTLEVTKQGTLRTCAALVGCPAAECCKRVGNNWVFQKQ
jgi:hypothetical protein